MEQLLIFLIGSFGYGLLEIIWRGYSHWTMLITGGLCFLILYNLFNTFKYLPIILKAFIGSVLITVIELLTGILINIILGWNVWDYSNVPYNILGQVCLLYSLLWFFISIPLIFLSEFLKKKITSKKQTQ